MKHNNYKTRAGRRARSRLARVLTLLALLLAATGAWAQDDPTYNVRLKAGTKDAANWTITPDEATTTGVPAETAVTLKYGGRMKVKGVTARTYDPLETPLTLEALTARTIMVTTPKVGMKYKKNNGALSTLNSTDDVTIDVQEGDKVEFYGNGTSITCYDGTMITGSGDGFKCKVYGNIMSLVDEEGFATAKELTEKYALYGLFANNSTLKDASGLLLPATTLAEFCYSYMFQYCSSLKDAPELPATELVIGCYSGMFIGCSYLEAAPELPATTLAPACYYGMFEDCSALTEAPALPATTLVDYCYYMMFSNCTNLQSVTCLATSGINSDNSTDDWLKFVPQTGTFIKAKDANWPSGESGIPEGWTVKLSPLTTPLTMEALTAGTIKVKSPKVGMKYKKNNDALSTVNSTDDVTIDVQEGDKVEFYGNGTSITSYNGTYIAGGTAEVKVYGNIMSLVNEQNYPTAKELTEQYALCGLFGNNTTLKDASGLLLPATTLADECYGYLFGDCTALTAAPELPATTLAKGCYTSMFKDCTALTAAPKVLPAKTLAAYCCHQMFQGCVKLTKAPELPATTLAPNCYNRMFKDCIELTTSPVLRATMLASSCYAEMFIGCSKLNTVICLATDVSADNCFSCWLYNIPSVGTLYVSADLASDDVPKMLDGSGWAVRVYVAPDD